MAEYIERETAYKTLTDYYHHTTETMHAALREALSRIPAADVAPVRHGRWLNCKPYNPEFNGYECSECGAKYQGFSPDNYCPNCGARTDGGEPDEH